MRCRKNMTKTSCKKMSSPTANQIRVSTPSRGIPEIFKGDANELAVNLRNHLHDEFLQKVGREMYNRRYLPFQQSN